MLVLARNINDRVAIGDRVIVQVIDIRDGVVRLGFTATKDVKIDREEVLTREEMRAVEDRATGRVQG